MSEHQTTLEKIAPSIEEAVSEGLQELGLPRDAVEIEVLDEGKSGLFGLGSRQARVKITVLEAQETPAADNDTVIESTTAPPDSAETESEPIPNPAETDELTEADEALLVARDTVAELLEKMHVTAQVDAQYISEEDSDRQSIWIDINGDDLSILIGRKAETLNALQYITSLIVGKELGRSVPLSVDVEGYRNRRAQQLKQLADRVADQVVETQRSQSLEPMPPAERRIVHIHLRNHPEAYTESVGEGDRRKIVIFPRS